MWKKIIFFGVPLIFQLYSFSLFGATPTRHLTELRSNFPYGLLTDDFGILTKDDLAINACLATPAPVTPGDHAYQYWQCFESRNISVDCDSSDIPDEHEGIMGLLVVKAVTDKILHEYIERRLWPIKNCKSFVKDVVKILKGTQHACISASFIDKELNVPKKETMSWTFERIKTINGCEGRDCDFTKKFKQTNCQNPKR